MTNYNRVLAYTSGGQILRSELVADADNDAVHEEFLALPSVQGVTSIPLPASAFVGKPATYRAGA